MPLAIKLQIKAQRLDKAENASDLFFTFEAYEFNNGLIIVPKQDEPGLTIIPEQDEIGVLYPNRHAIDPGRSAVIININEYSASQTFKEQDLLALTSIEKSIEICQLVEELCFMERYLATLRRRATNLQSKQKSIDDSIKTTQAKALNLFRTQRRGTQLQGIEEINEEYLELVAQKPALQQPLTEYRELIGASYSKIAKQPNLELDYCFVLDPYDEVGIIRTSEELISTEVQALKNLIDGYVIDFDEYNTTFRVYKIVPDTDEKVMLSQIEALEVLKSLMNEENLQLLEQYKLPVMSIKK